MRIGDLVFAEWSHNGRLRGWDADSQRKPEFYKDRYFRDELCENSSYDIVHHHKGKWVSDVERYIIQQTGIRLQRKIR